MAQAHEARDLLPSGNSRHGDDYDLLSREEVQKILGINSHTFYKYRRQYPSFRTIKVGNRRKMRRGALRRFLKELEEEQA